MAARLSDRYIIGAAIALHQSLTNTPFPYIYPYTNTYTYILQIEQLEYIK